MELNNWIALLRERRVKLGVDYAYTTKYGQIHVLCCDVFKDAVVETAKLCGLDLTSINTYE